MSAAADPLNVAAHLALRAAQEPHRPAVVFPHARDAGGRVAYTHLTFAQLHAASDRLAHGLAGVGVGVGARTVLMVAPSLEFFTLTFALFKRGAVPVLIDPGMGVRNLGVCLREAEPEAFIGVPRAHRARRLLGWARRSVRVTVSTGRKFLHARHALAELDQLGAQAGPYPCLDPDPDTTAAILFTSGSTGVAKGVVYRHETFARQVESLRQIYQIQPGERDLATFPLFALFAPALGMTAIVPEMDPTRPADVNPERIREAIENFGVTNLFGSPALLNRVGRAVEQHGWRFPSLKRVISAGAPVPARVIERFVPALSPGVQVFTPYGATEALPVASIGSEMILGETRHATDRGRGVCVGHPVAGMEACIIAIDDAPIEQKESAAELPAGEVGEICVCGPVVTREYFRRDAATRQAKMRDARGRVWHRMGDLGYLDAQGRIWFCGRKSHRVVTPRGTLFTIPCEAIFNTHPGVFRSALVGVKRGGAIAPVVVVEPLPSVQKSLAEWRVELRTLARTSPLTEAIDAFLVHPRFPVDIRHNAKIFREKLAVWAARQL